MFDPVRSDYCPGTIRTALAMHKDWPLRLIFKDREDLGHLALGGWRLRIPAKANADSEGNANGIPGRRRTVLGA